MIDDANEYEAISRLFDLVCEGKADSSELDLLDSQIAKGLEQAYQSAESAVPYGA
jgi:hypothetical protein